MSEITGGELKYVATIDTTQLDESLLNSEGKLKGFTEVAELTGQQLDNVVTGNVVENLKKLGLQSTLTGKDMTNAIKNAEDFVKGMEMGLKGALDYQKELKKEISKLKPGEAQNELIAEYLNIEKEIPEVVKAIEDAKNIVSSFKEENLSLSTKLKAVREEMQQLILTGQQDSQKYEELKVKANEYKSAIDEVNSELKALGGNQSLDALVETMGFASGAFATAQGVMGLFVGENEDLDRIMVKMQSTMSVAIGLQQLQNSLQKESAFNVKVLSKVKELWAIATGKVSVGLRALGASEAVATAGATTLLGVLSGGILLAIPALIYAFDKFSEKQKEQSELNKKIADSAAEPLVAYRKLQMQWNALGDDIRAKRKFIDENKDSFHDLGFEVNGVNDAENVLVKKTSSVVEALMLRAKAAAYKEKAIETQKKAIEAKEEENVDLYPGGYKSMINEVTGIVGWRPYSILNTESYDLEKKAKEYTEKEMEALKEASEKLSNAGIKEYSETKSSKTSKTSKTSKKVADEYLPPGSVAEIQKRMQKIDEALSKANNDKSIEELKKRKIATMIELAEAERQIAVKSQQEQNDYMKKTIDTRNQLLKAGFSKDVVDEIYPELKDTSYLDYLEKTRNELEMLVSSGGGAKAAEDLKIVNEEIDRLYGERTEAQKFTEDIDVALTKLPTLVQQIEFLQQQMEKQDSKAISDGKYAFLNNELEARMQEQKEMFQSLLDEQKSYAEKSIELEKEYQSNLTLAGDDVDKINKVNNHFSKKAIDLFFDEMSGSEEWTKVFTDMNAVTTSKLEEFKAILQQKLSEAKTIEDKIKIGEFITKIDDTLRGRNPFKSLIQALKDLGDETKTKEERFAALAKAINSTNSYLEAGKSIINDVKGMFDDLGISMDNAFGDVIESIDKALEGLSQLAQGAEEFSMGMSTGNPIQMITGAVKAIGGIVKSIVAWTNGDRKKERQIKRWAESVAELKSQYEQLDRAVSKALGGDKYKVQELEIKNLQKQAELIKQMRDKEKDKKKSDGGKISEYNSQIQSINNQIEDIKNNIVKNVLQTDAVDAAGKLGDALVAAFSKGEDASKAMRETANSMIQDIVKNALKMRLEKAMQPLLEDLLKQVGFNLDGSGSFSGLTPEQIEEFKNKVATIGEQGQEFLNAYKDLFQGMDVSNSAKGLKGDIKGITEKTAGALEAQINAMRIKQVETSNFIRDILLNIIQIEVNTRRLHNMDKNLAELNAKTKNQLAGL